MHWTLAHVASCSMPVSEGLHHSRVALPLLRVLSGRSSPPVELPHLLPLVFAHSRSCCGRPSATASIAVTRFSTVSYHLTSSAQRRHTPARLVCSHALPGSCGGRQSCTITCGTFTFAPSTDCLPHRYPLGLFPGSRHTWPRPRCGRKRRGSLPRLRAPAHPRTTSPASPASSAPSSNGNAVTTYAGSSGCCHVALAIHGRRWGDAIPGSGRHRAGRHVASSACGLAPRQRQADAITLCWPWHAAITRHVKRR